MTIKEFKALNETEKAQCRIDWAIAACCIIPTASFIIGILLSNI